MINSELSRVTQQFQALNWRSSSQDRKIALEGINRACQNLAQLSFQERSSCYSALTVVEQHEYKHLFIWVRLFEWIRSKFNSNFCTTNQLLSKVREEKKRCETLYLTNRHLPAADLKELQTLHDKNSVRTHLSTFGQCLITPAEKALSTAIKIKRLSEVKNLCAQHTPQRLLNQEYRPENILQTALEVKNKEIINFLLQAGAKIYTPDIYGNTLLHFLVSRKDFQIDYKEILQQVPLQDILTAFKVINENNDTPLTAALYNQNTLFLDIIFDRLKNEGREALTNVINDLINMTETVHYNFFYIAIRNNKVEWLKLLSTTQLLESIKKINNSNIIPKNYLTIHLNCFEYLMEKASENNELKDILSSKIENALLTQMLKDNYLRLLKKFRDFSPFVFHDWICSSIQIDSKTFDNPLIYVLSLKKLEYVKEILYFYAEDLGDIFINPKNGFIYQNTLEVVFYDMIKVLVSSCIEAHMKKATSWSNKLKWLEVRSLFGKLLPSFEIPLPANKEEFIEAFERNKIQVKRLLTKKIEYTDHDMRETSLNAQSIFDIAINNNTFLFIFQILNEQDSIFLDEISRKPECMIEIIRNQKIEVIRYISKASLLATCQDGFKNYNYLNTIITYWEDKIPAFFEYLRPTSTSTPSYKKNFEELFRLVDKKQRNLLHLAVQANCPYVFHFLKTFNMELFKKLNIQKDLTGITPLRLILEEFNIKTNNKINILKVILEDDYPTLSSWLIETATYWPMNSRSQKITFDLYNYIVSELNKSESFSTYLLHFADPLGINPDNVIKHIHLDCMVRLIVDKNQFETSYIRYPEIIKKILNNKDSNGKSILQYACRYSIAHVIEVLAVQDADLLCQLVKDQDKQKNTLLHVNILDTLITQLHEHVPNLLQECLLIKNMAEQTPLMLAEQSRNERLIVAIMTSQVSYIISKVQDLQQLAGYNVEEIAIERTSSALIRQKKILEERIIYLRQQIRVKQVELRAKNLKMPFLMPTEEEILKYKENVSHRSKATGCAKIPPADSKIDIGKLKTYFDRVYNKLPDEAKINDDKTLRQKLDVKNNFYKHIDIFISESHQSVGSRNLNPTSKALITNILRHLTATFIKQEEAIESLRKANRSDINPQEMEKDFESDLKSVLIDHLGVGFFHCIDRIASECEEVYFEKVIGSAINLEGKALNNRIYNALLVYRREVFKNIVANIKTKNGARDPHNAATHRYYQKTLADKFELGSSELANGEENFELFALGSPKHSNDKRSRATEIESNFKEQYSPQELILRVKRMFDESNPLPGATEILSQWLGQLYVIREADKADLLLADGKWNPKIIALFLADPSIGVLQA